VLRLHLVVSSTARPFPAAGAAVCLDMGTVQGDLARWLGGCCHRLEYLLPDAAIAPSGEAIVDGLRGAVFPWAIDPTAADLQDMHDPAQDAPVILALRPGLVRRQVRHDLRPLIVGEPKQMRIHRLERFHDWRNRLGFPLGTAYDSLSSLIRRGLAWARLTLWRLCLLRTMRIGLG